MARPVFEDIMFFFLKRVPAEHFKENTPRTNLEYGWPDGMTGIDKENAVPNLQCDLGQTPFLPGFSSPISDVGQGVISGCLPALPPEDPGCGGWFRPIDWASEKVLLGFLS